MTGALPRRAARSMVRRWERSLRMAENPWAHLRMELDRGGPARFWWRDDDAVAATPALSRLLALRSALRLPLALAVIPAQAEPGLARAVAEAADVRVLVHGWDHADRTRGGGTPAEFCPGRSPLAVRCALVAGRQRLASLFGAGVLPVLVPPFNRLAPALGRAVRAAGFSHVSVDRDFPACTMTTRNVHADLMDWTRRTAVPAAEAIRPIVAALRLRRYGLVARETPIGIMTHHLAHDGAAWDLAEQLLTAISSHAAAYFPPIGEVFAEGEARPERWWS